MTINLTPAKAQFDMSEHKEQFEREADNASYALMERFRQDTQSDHLYPHVAYRSGAVDGYRAALNSSVVRGMREALVKSLAQSCDCFFECTAECLEFNQSIRKALAEFDAVTQPAAEENKEHGSVE